MIAEEFSSKALSSLRKLSLTIALVSLTATALALSSPHLPESLAASRWLAQLWCILVLLACARTCPPVPLQTLAFAAVPATVLGTFYVTDASVASAPMLCLVTWCVLMLGCLVGGHIGGLLEYPGMLMVVAYVAALGDCFSVFHPRGPTANVLADPRALSLLTLSFPVLGTERLAPVVGVGDVAFACVFVVGARTVGLDSRRTLVALGAAMACVVAAVEVSGWPLPAVPFMSAAVVLAHREARSIPRQRLPRVALNLAAVTGLLASLWRFA